MNKEELVEIMNNQITIINQDLTKEQKRDFIIKLVKSWKKEEPATVNYEIIEKEVKIA
ncbi:MAG: hypothetical protein MJ229_05515 [bacterium]|nr:hypothetical protein [bacterium]